MSQAGQNEHFSEFLMGLTMGLVGGLVTCLFLSPRSGAANRKILSELPDRLRSDWDNPYGKTHGFIDRGQVEIEGKVAKFKEYFKAKRSAEAKRREKDAYETN